MIPGTNAGSTARRGGVIRSRHKSLGCQGVMLAAPYYSLPTEDELFEHFRAVDRAIGHPGDALQLSGPDGRRHEPGFH